MNQHVDNMNTTTAQITNNSQLDKANEVLKGLAINVTREDRRACEKKLKVSRFTVGAYLAGEGKDLDTAMSVIGFFQQRIEEREKKLQGAA